MKTNLMIGAGLIAACAGGDPNPELPPLTLDPPPGAVVLVREARGSAEGGNDLFLPSRPILLNGDVWVLDEGNDQLVRFDSTLSRARTFGRAGEGPGEIEFAQDLVLDRDRLIVAETGNGRFSVFDTSGTFRATLPASRSPRYVATTDRTLIATMNPGDDYAYRVSPDGGISPHLLVPPRDSPPGPITARELPPGRPIHRGRSRGRPVRARSFGPRAGHLRSRGRDRDGASSPRAVSDQPARKEARGNDGLGTQGRDLRRHARNQANSVE